MLNIFIYLLSFLLVVTCVLLVLLILMQLPKKEAGLGTAFGGGTADALFGAGAGNVLTKATKILVVAFFVLCLSLTILQNQKSDRSIDFLRKNLDTAAGATTNAPVLQPTPSLNLSNTLTIPTDTTAPVPSTQSAPAETAAPVETAPSTEQAQPEQP